MKVVVIGFGQGGSQIAEEFARLNKRARRQRRIRIITDTFAVNTNVAELSRLSTIKHDSSHRIVIESKETKGQGTGMLWEVGAEIARKERDKIIRALGPIEHRYESDAFLLVAGAAGGTGSGAMPVVAEYLKECFAHKPIYALTVLPFDHEVDHGGPTAIRALYNTAVCLKLVSSVADAVILVDNQRFIRKGLSLENNMRRINETIVEPFYNLLCSGEERKAKHVGLQVLDAGDIKETLSGWTAIGYGKLELPVFRLPFKRTRDFHKKDREVHRGIQAMDEAFFELSLNCGIADARKALYLISAPASEISMDLITELSYYMRSKAPQAVLRNGDYPREKAMMDVVLVLSQLGDMDKASKRLWKTTLVNDPIAL